MLTRQRLIECDEEFYSWLNNAKIPTGEFILQPVYRVKISAANYKIPLDVETELKEKLALEKFSRLLYLRLLGEKKIHLDELQIERGEIEEVIEDNCCPVGNILNLELAYIKGDFLVLNENLSNDPRVQFLLGLNTSY